MNSEKLFEPKEDHYNLYHNFIKKIINNMIYLEIYEKYNEDLY